LVDYSGQWHQIPDAGINPLPIQQPIPIWFGGHAEVVLQRAAKLADGWLPTYTSAEAAKPAIARLSSYLQQAGRESSEFGIEARIRYAEGNPVDWEQLLMSWQEAGATHISFNTMQAGLDGPAEHIQALKLIASSLDITHL
jgi:hypothetical protein